MLPKSRRCELSWASDLLEIYDVSVPVLSRLGSGEIYYSQLWETISFSVFWSLQIRCIWIPVQSKRLVRNQQHSQYQSTCPRSVLDIGVLQARSSRRLPGQNLQVWHALSFIQISMTHVIRLFSYQILDLFCNIDKIAPPCSCSSIHQYEMDDEWIPW